MSIALHDLTVSGSTISVDVEAGDASRWLQSGRLLVEYQGGIDLSDIDPAILILPALGAVLPVCYATGVGVHVQVVDSVFALAAERMAPLWSAAYPKFARASSFALSGKRTAAGRKPGGRGALLLYSGGLDSVTSLLANRDHVRCLLSVWGGDVGLSDLSLWQELTSLISESPMTADYERITARTNWRELVKQFRLIHDFMEPGGDWWAGAQHGLTLLTLAAPVTAARGLEMVYIASSHTADYLPPHGSAPDTDNLVRWTGTDVKHDCFELTRQDKIIQHIAPYMRAGGSIDLAVCHQPGRGHGKLNCGRCEKCLRTATGLMAAGVTPAHAGLDIRTSEYMKWRAELSTGKRTLDVNEIYMWRGLQAAIPDDLVTPTTSTGDYLAWVRGFDFNTTAERPASWGERLRPAARYQLRRFADHLPQSAQQRLRTLRPGRSGARSVVTMSPGDDGPRHRRFRRLGSSLTALKNPLSRE